MYVYHCCSQKEVTNSFTSDPSVLLFTFTLTFIHMYSVFCTFLNLQTPPLLSSPPATICSGHKSQYHLQTLAYQSYILLCHATPPHTGPHFLSHHPVADSLHTYKNTIQLSLSFSVPLCQQPYCKYCIHMTFPAIKHSLQLHSGSSFISL